MLRQIIFCAVGIVILGGTFLAMLVIGGAAALQTMGLLLPLAEALANIGFWAPAAIMVYVGLTRPNSVGWLIAPLAFCLIWLSVSLALRASVSRVEDRLAKVASVDVRTRLARTLIVEGPYPVPYKIVADGYVDRLLTVPTATTGKELVEIKEISLGRGSACSEADRQRSSALHAVGRTDECYRTRSVAELPDGLLLRQRLRSPYQALGCCDEMQALLRTGDREELLSVWRRGYSRVLSYIPIAAFDPQPSTIWSATAGPIQKVWYGSEDIAPKHIADEIYGVDLASPVKAANVGGPELSRRTAALAQSGQMIDRRSAAQIALQAVESGYADEGIIRAAVAGLGSEPPATYDARPPPLPLFHQLSAEQRRMYRRLLLERLSIPEACSWCNEIRTGFASDRSTSHEALRIFTGRLDLFAWQYQGLLQLYLPLFHRRDREHLALRENAFDVIVQGEQRGFAPRMTAFARNVGRRFSGAELTAIAGKLSSASDAQLREFIRAIGPIPPDIIAKSKHDEGLELDEAAWRSYWAAVATRIGQVADERLRQELHDRIP